MRDEQNAILLSPQTNCNESRLEPSGSWPGAGPYACSRARERAR